MFGISQIGKNLSYLSQIAQSEPTVWRKPENCEKIIGVVEQTLEQLKSSNVSSVDFFRLKILAQRIHEKMPILKQEDSLQKIWQLCINISWQSIRVPSSAESSNFLNTFSFDSFKKFYSIFENRKCILELLEINKKEGSYQALVEKIEGWMSLLERPLSQKDLFLLIPNIKKRAKHSSALLPFKQLLQCHGFSSTVNGIDFSIPEIVKKYWGTGESGTILHYIDFSNVTFINCKFSWVNFSGSLFKQCFFQKCDLSFCVIKNSGKFIETRFEDCQLTRSFLHYSVFQNSFFTRCDLQYASLFSSQFENVLMKDCLQTGTSFLGANIESGCKMTSNNPLKDCLFFGTEKNFDLSEAIISTSLKCKIGFWWNLDNPNPTTRKAETSVIKSECLPIRGDDNPDHVNPNALTTEIGSILSTFRTKELSRPIVQEIIRTVQDSEAKHFPEFKKLVQKAKQLVENSDCLLLPGGKDIEAEFYKKPGYPAFDADYRRTLLEFLSIYFAEERGLPIVGICRGMQLTGVYHGAELIQDIPGQMGKLQQYSMEAPVNHGIGMIRHFMQSPVRGLSMHHQALKPETVPKELEVVSIREKVIKAAEGKIGAPILLFQWHPETQSDPNDRLEKILYNIKVFLPPIWTC